VNFFNNLKSLSHLFPFLILLIFVSCAKEEVPKSSLVVKDNLLYKRDSDIPFTGREKAVVEDRMIEYDVKDGYKHGEFKIYYLDGTPEMIGLLDSNRNVGKWQYFHPNGKLESEGNFNYDIPDGRWFWFDSKGNKIEEGIFENGKRVGVWIQYDSLGKIIFEKNYDMEDTLNLAEDSTKTIQ